MSVPNKNKRLIVISGATAIGKTALSIQLAQHFNSEIISADSRQFYKELKIGAAPPSEEELAKVKHHFIQHLSVKDDYNVGLFEKDAIALLQNLFKKTDTLIMVGGSGLYMDAVCNGLDKACNYALWVLLICLFLPLDWDWLHRAAQAI